MYGLFNLKCFSFFNFLNALVKESFVQTQHQFSLSYFFKVYTLYGVCFCFLRFNFWNLLMFSSELDDDLLGEDLLTGKKVRKRCVFKWSVTKILMLLNLPTSVVWYGLLCILWSLPSSLTAIGTWGLPCSQICTQSSVCFCEVPPSVAF